MITVPELAEVPDTVLGQVFVFTSGVEPEGATGPFGFQPDVSDSVPGDEVEILHERQPRPGTTLTRSAYDRFVVDCSDGKR